MEENYFTVKKYLLDMYNSLGRQFSFKGNSKEEHCVWKNNLRKKLFELTGINKMQYCDLNPTVIESVEFENYRRDKIIIQTQPQIYMPMYVLVPHKCNNIPIIALHGHSSDGKNGVVGITNELTEDKIIQYNYTYGLDFAEKGYIVFCPDLCGSGERREEKQQGDLKVLQSSCNDINNAAQSLGISLLGLMLFDIMRLIDYIEMYDCRKEKIVCCGFSGGALVTLWISALDERVKCSAVSGYYHGLRDTVLENNLCGCNFVANMWKYIDICDLGALVAPKNFIVETGDKDSLNGKRGLLNFYEQIENTKKVYDLYGKNKENSFKYKVFSGGHKWYGAAYDFIDDWSEMLE